MNQPRSSSTRRVALAGAALLLTVALAACGSSAPASTTPSIAAPSVALPSVALPSVALPSVAPGGSGGVAVDPAAGLTIDPPYTLTAVPAILQNTLETQMAAGLGAFGDAIKVGFRQVGGSAAGSPILMVMAFPSGTLSAAGYQAALGGMGTSLGATFTTTTVDGVEVSTGKASTGGIGVFHIGDVMLVIISPSEAEVAPIATALIGANQ